MNQDMLRDHEATLARLQAVCTHDLLLANYADSDRTVHLNGFCYVLTQGMIVLYPNDFIPYRVGWAEGGSHWYAVERATKRIFDTIATDPQLRSSVLSPTDYKRGKPSGYRNRLPEKRAKVLLERAGYVAPYPNQTRNI